MAHICAIHLVVAWITFCSVSGALASTCTWSENSKTRRFVRVREDAPLGYSILSVNVTAPKLLKITFAQDSEPLFRVSSALNEGRVLVTGNLPQMLMQQQTSPVVKFMITCGDSPFTQQVTVYVEDVNDHAPVFTNTRLALTVDELTPLGLTVLSSIKATDADKANTANSEVELLIGEGDLQGYFELVDRKKGVLRLAKMLDYERGPRYFNIQIIAKDNGVPSLSSTATLSVTVQDADDSDPLFSHTHYSLSIPEDDNTANTVYRPLHPSPPILAADGDEGVNASISYSLVTSEHSNAFSINPLTGSIAQVLPLDRETLETNPIRLHVTAKQNDNPHRESSSVLDIFVTDVNDNIPMFEHDVYAISIVENLPTGFSVVQVNAKDMDLGINSEFEYIIKGGNGALRVNPQSGWLTVANHSILDRETVPLINLKVCAVQKAPLVKTTDTEKTPQPSDGIKESVNRKRQTSLADAPKMDASNQSKSVTRNTIPFKPSPRIRIVGKDTKRVRPFHRRHKSIESNLDDVTEAPEGEESTLPILNTVPFGVRTAPRKPPVSTDKTSENELPVKKTLPKLIPKRVISIVLNDRTKRDASRRFNSQRGNVPKSLVPIRMIISGEKDVTVQSDRKDKQLSLDSSSLSCCTVQLSLLDANDNNPDFKPSNKYHFTVREDAVPGMRIGKVQATDADEGVNGQVTYQVQDRGTNNNTYSNNSAITIDSTTGDLFLNAKLTPSEFTMFIEASDNPISASEKRTSLAIVVISVTTGDSWEPRFEGLPFEFWVGGDAEVGTSVGQVRVADMDPKVTFFDMFHHYEEGVPLAIEEKSGIVSVVRPISQFSRPFYEFEAVVTDGKKTLASNLTVHVATINRSTKRTDIVVQMNVQENLAGGLVGNIQQELQKLGMALSPEPHLELVSPQSREMFVIAQDGSLYTGAALDHEAEPSHTLVVLNPKESFIFYVKVQVEDINDNPPQLNAVYYEGSISEDAREGTEVFLSPPLKVVDLDSYNSSSWSLKLSGKNFEMFRVDQKSKTIIFKGGKLDRETIPSYNLQIQAIDDGDLFTSANLTIKLEDVNDNYPIFSNDLPILKSPGDAKDLRSLRKITTPSGDDQMNNQYSVVRIPESLPIGSRVTQVDATDKDVGLFADIRYMIESQTAYDFGSNSSGVPQVKHMNSFLIDTKTGYITVGAKLLPTHFFILNISAVDGGGLSTITMISIAVYDVNDHAPVFLNPGYNFNIIEGSYLVGEVGVVKAVDEDFGQNSEIFYQLVVNGSQNVEEFPFRIGENSGIILATGRIDREGQSKYEFSIVASDKGTPVMSTSVPVFITVSDSNDHGPVFYGYQKLNPIGDPNSNKSEPIYMQTVPENIPVGTIISSVYANDSDSHSSGNGIVLYKIKERDSPLSIDPNNGSVYTVKKLDYEENPLIRVTIIAQDVGTPAKSSSAYLELSLSDVQENATDRLFDMKEYKIMVAENSQVPLSILNASSVWPSLTAKGVHFMLSDIEDSNTVSVNRTTGEIHLTRTLDREVQKEFRFRLRAMSPVQVFRSGSVSLQRARQTPSSILRLTTRLPSTNHHQVTEPTTTGRRRDRWRGRNRRGTGNAEHTVDLLRTGTDNRRRSYLVPSGTRSFGRRLVYEDELMRKRENVKLLKNHQETKFSRSLQLNEVWIVIRVLDVNDNPPVFVPRDKPYVAAVTSTAQYGQHVLFVRAFDSDEGTNGAVVYSMKPTHQNTHKFALQDTTGEVTVVGDLSSDIGKMFSFEVTAVDNRGLPGGFSSSVPVVIHVLNAKGQVVVEIEAPPKIVEPYLPEIQRLLANASGYDIRIQRIAPHIITRNLHTNALNTRGPPRTDLYIYAVSPDSQEVVPGKKLRETLREESPVLPLKVMGFRTPPSAVEGVMLQTPEMAILLSAAVVLLVTLSAMVCACHKTRKRRRKPHPSPFTSGIGITGSGGMSVMPLSFPVGPLPYTHISDHSSASSDDQNKLRHSKLRSLEDHQLGEFHFRKGSTHNFLHGRNKSIRSSRREDSTEPCGRIHSHTAECCQTFSSSGGNSDEDGLPARSPITRHRRLPDRSHHLHLVRSISPTSEEEVERGDHFRRSRMSKRCRGGGRCYSHDCCLDTSSTHHLHRNNSPDSLERNSHRNSHYGHRHHLRRNPKHHSSLHSLSQVHNSSRDFHGSTPALVNYPYVRGQFNKMGPPPPVPPNKPKPSTFEVHNNQLIALPRGQLRKQVNNDVTEL